MTDLIHFITLAAEAAALQCKTIIDYTPSDLLTMILSKNSQGDDVNVKPFNCIDQNPVCVKW